MISKYDCEAKSIEVGVREILQPDLVIVHGALVLYNPQLRELLDLSVYLDVDADTRLSKRVVSSNDRNIPLEVVLTQYINYVKPSYEHFVRPTKAEADIIIPRGDENEVALSLVVQYIKDCLLERTAEDVKVALTAVNNADNRVNKSNQRSSVILSGDTMERKSSSFYASMVAGMNLGDGAFAEIPK